MNRSDLPARANEHRDDQDEDDESEDHQAQVRGLELRAGPSDRRRRPGVDRCPAAVAHTAGIRYRCGRGVRIVGPVNAQISSFRFFLLFTSPQVKATERVGDRDRLRGFDLSEQPRDPAPFLWMHRQHVDDVGPIVSVLVAVAKQLRGDRVTVGLVVDQNVAEGVAGRGRRDPGR